MVYEGTKVDCINIVFRLKEKQQKDSYENELLAINLLDKRLYGKYRVGKNIKNNKIDVRIENPIGDLMVAYGSFYKDNNLNERFLEDIYEVIKEEFSDVCINLLEKTGDDIDITFEELIKLLEGE